MMPMDDAGAGAGGSIEEFLLHDVFAVAGVSSNEEKYGTKVFRDLRRAGRRVYGLNPRLDSLDGEKVFPDLGSLPETPQVLVLVVPAAVGLGLVEEAARRGIRRIWMQPGAESDALLKRCEELGLRTVHDQCVMIEIAARRSRRLQGP